MYIRVFPQWSCGFGSVNPNSKYSSIFVMKIISNIQGLSSMILILMLDAISGINAFANRMRLALGRTNQRCIIMLVPYSRFPLLVGGLLLIIGSGLLPTRNLLRFSFSMKGFDRSSSRKIRPAAFNVIFRLSI